MPDEDWDTLVILDACRYDLMAELDPFDAPVEQKTSPSTYTLGYLRETFGDADFPEIVFVTANPNFESIPARFHERVTLWDDEWDENVGVTPPEAVTEAAIETYQEYPHKRLIVHYMQPHYPFIGDLGRQLAEEGTIHYEYAHGDDFWRQLEQDDVDEACIWDAYKENLELVIPHVEDLLEAVPGRTVVTSDHGNEFGRFGIYGHPDGAHSPGLVRIPWVVLDDQERRSTTSGTATAGPIGEDDVVAQRLADLGYADT
ncbi:hypothetical protein [Natrinema halophilum]|uniref:Sulfatase n=1 Tax=Natrinema halophilum TaxID=1699371 RepID=A0A7D5KR25_9EURY|nr:hypothetical protein [Natrinema halophilum]QLG48917.1 hypothetical protein HYG82_08665 [Natrinema halophilum]